MHDIPRLLRTRQAAAYCGFSKSTFEKMRVTGGGAAFTRRGSSVYYAIQDLDDWLAKLPRYYSTSEADAADAVEATS